jgi:hypothetical protein
MLNILPFILIVCKEKTITDDISAFPLLKSQNLKAESKDARQSAVEEEEGGKKWWVEVQSPSLPRLFCQSQVKYLLPCMLPIYSLKIHKPENFVGSYF